MNVHEAQTLLDSFGSTRESGSRFSDGLTSVALHDQTFNGPVTAALENLPPSFRMIGESPRT